MLLTELYTHLYNRVIEHNRHTCTVQYTSWARLQKILWQDSSTQTCKWTQTCKMQIKIKAELKNNHRKPTKYF